MEGGTLIIEEGAFIQLWDGNKDDGSARIHIQSGGELVINGLFNFSGNGYFEFDEGHMLTMNSDFRLGGKAKTSRMVQLNEGCVLQVPANGLIWSSGEVVYKQGSSIELNDDAFGRFTKMTFSGARESSAIVAHASQYLLFFDIDIKDFPDQPAVSATNLQGIALGAPFGTQFFLMNESEVSNCRLGLELGSFEEFNINKTKFLGGEEQRAIIATRIDKGRLNSVVVDNYSTETAITLTDVGSTLLRRSTVSNNLDGIYVKQGILDGVTLSVNCSNIENNFYGIVVDQMPLGVNLSMSFSSLSCNLVGLGGTDINLNIDQGFNDFNLCNASPGVVLFDLCHSGAQGQPPTTQANRNQWRIDGAIVNNNQPQASMFTHRLTQSCDLFSTTDVFFVDNDPMFGRVLGCRGSVQGRPVPIPCVDNSMTQSTTCSSTILKWDIPIDPITFLPIDYDYYEIWYGPIAGIAPSRIFSPDPYQDDITLYEPHLDGTLDQILVGALAKNTEYAFYVVPFYGGNSPGWCTPGFDTTLPNGDCDIIIDTNNPNMFSVWHDIDQQDPWTGSTSADNLFDRLLRAEPDVAVDCCNLPQNVTETSSETYSTQGEYIYIDLLEPYDINAINLYDGAGEGTISIEFFNELTDSWEFFVDAYITNANQVWKPFADVLAPCQGIQQLRIYTSDHDNSIGELVLCGKPTANYAIQPDEPWTEDPCATFQFQSHISTHDMVHEWDFDGDGIVDSNDPNPVWIAPVNGTYIVKHIIRNVCNEITFEYEIQVGCISSPEPPNPPEPNNPVCGDANTTITGTTTLSQAIADGNLLDHTSAANTSQHVNINGTLVLDGSSGYTFVNGSEIEMGPGARIIVPDNFTFIIKGTQIHGCSNLHRGILVQENGLFSMLESSKMSDALYGVQFMNNSSVTIMDSEFKKNYIGVYSNLTGVNAPSTNLIVQGSNFNCTADTLLSPYSGQQVSTGSISYAGVELIESGAHYNIGGNGNSQNEFKDICNGILSKGSVLHIENNTFENILSFDQSYSKIGTAIDNRTGSLVADNNQITNAWIGFYAYDSDSEIKNNTLNEVEFGIWQRTFFPNDVLIENNNIETKFHEKTYRTKGIEISAQNGANRIELINNYMSNSTPSAHIPQYVGLTVWSTGNVLPGSPLLIKDCTVDLYAGWGITMQSAENASIVGNNINFKNNIGPFFGLSVHGTNDSDVNCNMISGVSELGKGIELYNSETIDLQCNDLNNTSTGINVSGDCDGTLLKETYFGDHYYGIHMSQTAEFGNIQDHHGNTWNGQYTGAGAINWASTQADLDKTKFEVHTSGTPFHPGTIMLPHAPANSVWFHTTSGSPSNLCGSSSSCSSSGSSNPPAAASSNNGQFLGDIAEGNLTYQEYESQRIWQAERYLYRLIKSGSIDDVDNEILNNFYSNSESNNTGALYEVEAIKADMNRMSEVIKYNLSSIESEIEGLVSVIRQSSNEVPEGDDYDNWQTFSMERANIRSTLKGLMNEKKNLKSQLAANQKLIASALLYQNGGLADDEIFESNFKQLHDIYLRNVIDNDSGFSEADIDQLTFIANQCPIEGGRAVYLARSLLILAQEDLTWNDEDLCSVSESEQQTNDWNNKGNFSSDKFIGEVEVYPNPTKESFNIQLPESELPFTVVITNVLGQEQLSLTEMTSGNHSIQINDWNAGIYWMKVFLNKENVSVKKLIVVD